MEWPGTVEPAKIQEMIVHSSRAVPRLRAPIVLVHGLFGFDRLKIGGWTLASYFPGIPEFLASAGNWVKVASVSPTGSIAQRAGQLRALLDQQLPGEAVHILGHSMGGLDARYMISRLGMADRVLTLTTIGTPHRGSPFADWCIGRLERVVKPILDLCNLPYQAFYDLTTTQCRKFNELVPDSPRVRYFSVAGQHTGDWRSPHWQLSHQIVFRREGSNDGVVSVASATYGESHEIWEGDHLSLVNWLDPVAQIRGLTQDRTPQYAAIVQRLKDEGF